VLLLEDVDVLDSDLVEPLGRGTGIVVVVVVVVVVVMCVVEWCGAMGLKVEVGN
jgi:hypothetical protein